MTDSRSAIIYHEFIPDNNDPQHCAVCWQYKIWWMHTSPENKPADSNNELIRLQGDNVFGVEPYGPEDAVIHACGILDVVKSEWAEEWSEHDQKVRAGLSQILSSSLLSAPESNDPADYQGYCLKLAHPENPKIVCLCRSCKPRRCKHVNRSKHGSLCQDCHISFYPHWPPDVSECPAQIIDIELLASLQAQVETLTQEPADLKDQLADALRINSALRIALQVIVDDGNEESFAYGIALKALTQSAEVPSP